MTLTILFVIFETLVDVYAEFYITIASSDDPSSYYINKYALILCFSPFICVLLLIAVYLTTRANFLFIIKIVMPVSVTIT
jgi:hypothetical protein